MLERPRHAIGLVAARFHFRKVPDPVMSFSTAFSAARRILVVMPLDGSPLYPVAPVLTMLAARKKEEEIVVVVAEHSMEAIDALRRSPVVRLLAPDISAFFLPRKDALARICRTPYDVTIDCNLDFQLPSGYICRESGANVRVGFAGKRSDLFYNFQIQTAATESRTVRYERLAQCLAMF